MQRCLPVQVGCAAACDVLQKNGIVAIPTETVYGLAAKATEEHAVLKVFAAKGRPADNPLICHIADIERAAEYGELPPEFFALGARFWPGPLTLIVKHRGGIAPSVIANTGKVSFRIPQHEHIRELIRDVGVPLAAPSANRSGTPSATTAEHVARDFSEEMVPLILDGGASMHGIESTIVDLTPLEEGKPAYLVREGAISYEELSALVPLKRVQKLEEGMTVSPGLKHRHYAPQGSLKLFYGNIDTMSVDIQQQAGAKTVVIAASEMLEDFPESLQVLDGGPASDPRVAAHRFYDLLRHCDSLGATQIFCMTWPTDSAIGRALRQRQEKAAGLI